MPSKISIAQAARRPSPVPERISPRLRAAALVLGLMYLLLLEGLFRTGYWIFNPHGKPLMLDFLPMWLAGREALLGHAAAVYNLKSFTALQKAVAVPSRSFFPWPYPPIYFLPAALVASMPYFWAFVAWQAATLSGCLAVGYRIVRDPAIPVLILACPVSGLNLFVGQNGFLTAALIGGALLLLERRPWLAGCLIGALSYKPQFAVIFPIVLVVCLLWRPLVSAAATTLALALLAGAAFGMSTWLAFPAALLHRADTALVTHGLHWGKLQSLYGLGRSLGLGAAAPAAVQCAVALGVLAVTIALWRSRAGYALKAAALATATLAVTPYLFSYDLAEIVIAAAFLQRDRIERGGLPGERVAALLLFGGLLALLATSGNVAIGPAIVLGLFALIVRRGLARLPVRAGAA